MNCSLPPKLDDIQLLAYLEDVASGSTRAHLADCPYCQARAERLKEAEGRLAGRLFRVTCPETITLGEYYFERLAAEDQAAVAAHLSTCPHCSEELDQLQAYLQALAPELRPSLLAEAKYLLAERLRGPAGGGISGMAVPAFVGVRGETGDSLVYQADDIQIALQIAGDKDHPGRKKIIGLLSTEALNGASVFLWGSEELQAESSVSDTGHFSFGTLVSGEYTLIIGSPPLEIHLNVLIE